MCFKSKMKKETSHNIDWEKISKYLSGEMNEEESFAFEQIIDSNPEYAAVIRASEKDLNFIHKHESLNNTFETDDAWKSVKSRITNEGNKTIALNSWKKVLQIAAMIIVAIGLSIGSYEIYTNKTDIYSTAITQLGESGKTIQLADGSKVTLHGNSKLTYPKEFSSNERRVKLEGEAFFDIAKNPDKAFIIAVKDAEVKVLGTSFNVNAGNDHVEVLVETGKVLFSKADNPSKSLVLKKGDFAVLQDNQLTKDLMNDDNYLSWKTKKLVFKNMKLKDVAKVINRTYQVSIEFSDPNIEKLNINTTFNEDPLDNVLMNLCKPYRLKYEKHGTEIIIKKKVQ